MLSKFLPFEFWRTCHGKHSSTECPHSTTEHFNPENMVEGMNCYWFSKQFKGVVLGCRYASCLALDGYHLQHYWQCITLSGSDASEHAISDLKGHSVELN